jgi:tetratricopeptide (TPR) repeat protein
VRLSPPEPLRSLVPDLDPELEAIVTRCLAKAPGDRYARASDVAADLDRWLAGSSKPREKKRAPLGMAVTVLVGVAAFVLGRETKAPARVETPPPPPVVATKPPPPPPPAKPEPSATEKRLAAALDHARRAAKLRAEQRPLEASQECVAALELDSTCAAALQCRARLRLDRHEQVEEAIQDLSNAIALVQSGIASVQSSGLLHADRARAELETYDRSRTQAALDDAARAVELLPQEPDALAVRGRARIDGMFQGGARFAFVQAREDFDRALKLDPDHAEARAFRALLRTLADDRQGALEDAEVATKKAPHYGMGWASLAMALSERDRPRALKAIATALELEPWNPMHSLTRGNLRFEDQDLPGAKEDWKRCLEVAPQWVWAQVVRARLAGQNPRRR